jgi:hypothetical protein
MDYLIIVLKIFEGILLIIYNNKQVKLYMCICLDDITHNNAKMIFYLNKL